MAKNSVIQTQDPKAAAKAKAEEIKAVKTEIKQHNDAVKAADAALKTAGKAHTDAVKAADKARADASKAPEAAKKAAAKALEKLNAKLAKLTEVAA